MSLHLLGHPRTDHVCVMSVESRHTHMRQSSGAEASNRVISKNNPGFPNLQTHQIAATRPRECRQEEPLVGMQAGPMPVPVHCSKRELHCSGSEINNKQLTHSTLKIEFLTILSVVLKRTSTLVPGMIHSLPLKRGSVTVVGCNSSHVISI